MLPAEEFDVAMIGLQRLEEFLCEPFLSAGCTVAVDDAVEREGVHARCGVLVDGAADDDVVEAAGLLLRVVEFVASLRTKSDR